MPYKETYLPRDLVRAITRLFPAFQWDEGAAFGYNGDYTFHAVLQTFTPQSNELLKKATTNQKKEFGALINRLVDMGGDCENAISTCFLEHASQVEVRKFIEPYLSKEAKQELH